MVACCASKELTFKYRDCINVQNTENVERCSIITENGGLDRPGMEGAIDLCYFFFFLFFFVFFVHSAPSNTESMLTRYRKLRGARRRSNTVKSHLLIRIFYIKKFLWLVKLVRQCAKIRKRCANEFDRRTGIKYRTMKTYGVDRWFCA